MCPTTFESDRGWSIWRVKGFTKLLAQERAAEATYYERQLVSGIRGSLRQILRLRVLTGREGAYRRLSQISEDHEGNLCAAWGDCYEYLAERKTSSGIN